MNRWTLVATLRIDKPRNHNRRYATDFTDSKYSAMVNEEIWLKEEVAFTIRNTKRLAAGHRG